MIASFSLVMDLTEAHHGPEEGNLMVIINSSIALWFWEVIILLEDLLFTNHLQSPSLPRLSWNAQTSPPVVSLAIPVDAGKPDPKPSKVEAQMVISGVRINGISFPGGNQNFNFRPKQTKRRWAAEGFHGPEGPSCYKSLWCVKAASRFGFVVDHLWP